MIRPQHRAGWEQDTSIELARVTEQRDRALQVVAAAQDFVSIYNADDLPADALIVALERLRKAVAGIEVRENGSLT
ncbi:MAG TPA: hypothetical protein PLE61_15985 [Vicinamibacterales bacterium]|nr:hypothetical protein [Vicinamibacterales bacterium]